MMDNRGTWLSGKVGMRSNDVDVHVREPTCRYLDGVERCCWLLVTCPLFHSNYDTWLPRLTWNCSIGTICKIYLSPSLIYVRIF